MEHPTQHPVARLILRSGTATPQPTCPLPPVPAPYLPPPLTMRSGCPFTEPGKGQKGTPGLESPDPPWHPSSCMSHNKGLPSLHLISLLRIPLLSACCMPGTVPCAGEAPESKADSVSALRGAVASLQNPVPCCYYPECGSSLPAGLNFPTSRFNRTGIRDRLPAPCRY